MPKPRLKRLADKDALDSRLTRLVQKQVELQLQLDHLKTLSFLQFFVHILYFEMQFE
jgi:hypothetical protein